MEGGDVRGLSEGEIVYNSPLGAFLLWTFARKYCLFSKSDSVPFELLFIVLPLLYHGETRKVISSTQSGSGLRIFSAKLSKSPAPTFVIQDRVLGFRGLSLRCISTSIGMNLIQLLPQEGMVRILNVDDSSAPTEFVNDLIKASEKLGRWFAEVDIQEITKLLRILL
jgi:hypothetical protein